MTDTSSAINPPVCEYCQAHHATDGPCPWVKAITYYPDGSIERVEFREARSRANPKPTLKQKTREIIELYKAGAGVVELARAYGMSEPGVHNVILRHAPELRRSKDTHFKGVGVK